MTRAVVNLWGRQIGAVLWDEDRDVGVFEYTPEFSRSGIEVAPLTMPLRSGEGGWASGRGILVSWKSTGNSKSGSCNTT